MLQYIDVYRQEEPQAKASFESPWNYGVCIWKLREMTGGIWTLTTQVGVRAVIRYTRGSQIAESVEGQYSFAQKDFRDVKDARTYSSSRTRLKGISRLSHWFRMTMLIGFLYILHIRRLYMYLSSRIGFCHSMTSFCEYPTAVDIADDSSRLLCKRTRVQGTRDAQETRIVSYVSRFTINVVTRAAIVAN